jgi:hypothetical protein
MTEEKEITREDTIMTKSISKVIDSVFIDLKRIVKNLDNDLPSLCPSKISGYQEALDAINKYRIAVVERVRYLEMLNKEMGDD